MKTTFVLIHSSIAAIILSIAGCAVNPTPVEHNPIQQRYLVKFDIAAMAGEGINSMTSESDLLQSIVNRLNLPAAAEARLTEAPVARLSRTDGRIDLSHWMILSVALQSATPELLNSLRGNPIVFFAEPDYDFNPGQPSVRQPIATPQPPKEPVFPNDPLFPLQYYHRMIGATEAWKTTIGSPDIIVAILDSGCNTQLNDFKGRILSGRDFIIDSDSVADDSGHGTSVAAILAATGNNAEGIAGIDWRCRIMPIRMVYGGAASYAQAIEWATRSGCSVINISGKLELPESSAAVDEALRFAELSGVVVVASAGNQNREGIAYPARFPTVISVGSLAADGNSRWTDPLTGEGSNYGLGLTLCAPGAAIVTISKNGLRAMGSGTSASAPMAAGVCSLMRAVNPKLTPAQIRQILQDTADKIGPADSYVNGQSKQFGHGRLNAAKAVEKAAMQ